MFVSLLYATSAEDYFWRHGLFVCVPFIQSTDCGCFCHRVLRFICNFCIVCMADAVPRHSFDRVSGWLSRWFKCILIQVCRRWMTVQLGLRCVDYFDLEKEEFLCVFDLVRTTVGVYSLGR
ncbi:uncharacterized protein LOC113465036 [Ceratina calcarata]|uniref:Uncharacterized protein LOC113465036 n=1 Tax=Ceratina calcarata TaxID=156304 RepID=A0AAJ7SA46_9HYME|nr:uncharacterized protein LOC113465036 [Ceratina calcarata]XP_026674103.1 uncharacterized protein LOC113465036 [Ceratina calcarata]